MGAAGPWTLAGELVVAVEVAALDGDAELVAHLGCVVGEGAQGQDAFGLVADVEEDHVRSDGDDGGVNLLGAGAAVDRCGALAVVFLEEGGEVFFGCFRQREVGVLGVHVD